MLPTATPLLRNLSVRRGDPETIYRQLCRQIREKILCGDLEIGTRLPSTRELADEITVSRTTTREVYEQLIGEGYLSSTRGKGTFIIDHPVLNPISLERTSQSSLPMLNGDKSTRAAPLISKRGKELLSIPISFTTSEFVPFNPALPDFNLFPFSKWSRILKKTLINRDRAAMFYGDASGYFPLKQAIAQNLRYSRGLSCDPEQVIVVASSEQAIRRIAFLLLDRDDCVWFGEPGLQQRRNAFRSVGVTTLTVPVDNQGVVVEQAYKFKQKAKLAYVVPSGHYPIGHVMSLPRRLELLNWASTNNAWILEDDFCCEFNFSGLAPPPILSMEINQQVIYLGSFSMTLFPSLRLTYLVVPWNLVDAVKHIAQSEQSVSSVLQPALAEFISGGHFMTHVRNMRKTYLRRQQFLVQFLKHHIGDITTISGTNGGSNIILNLPVPVKDYALSEVLDRQGIIAHPLSGYYQQAKNQNEQGNGLVLGFACSSRVELERCARLLVEQVKISIDNRKTI
jgi:GntR family transcriptional regulator/MocR family aminotransferase